MDSNNEKAIVNAYATIHGRCPINMMNEITEALLDNRCFFGFKETLEKKALEEKKAKDEMEVCTQTPEDTQDDSKLEPIERIKLDKALKRLN